MLGAIVGQISIQSVISPYHIEGMKPLVRNLDMHMLDCGHWTQQEQPAEVNALLIDWLVKRR